MGPGGCVQRDSGVSGVAEPRGVSVRVQQGRHGFLGAAGANTAALPDVGLPSDPCAAAQGLAAGATALLARSERGSASAAVQRKAGRELCSPDQVKSLGAGVPVARRCQVSSHECRSGEDDRAIGQGKAEEVEERSSGGGSSPDTLHGEKNYSKKFCPFLEIIEYIKQELQETSSGTET